MKLVTAINMDDIIGGVMISFVGGGGKTSSIFTLAKELSQLGRKVLITTTTAMYNPINLDITNVDVLGEYVTSDGKLKGISKERANQIFCGKVYDVILVEADGSRGLPIKAPADYEPVVPTMTNVFIGVIGIDCIGKTIDNLNVHRPQLFTRVTGSCYGEIIDETSIISLISSDDGLFKNCPNESRRILLINKILNEKARDIAIGIGNKVLERCSELDTIIIGAVLENPPVISILKR